MDTIRTTFRGDNIAYEGQIAQIQIGIMGLMSDLAPSQIPHTALTKVINCDFAPGYVQKAPGAIQYNRSALSAGIIALLDYWPTTNKQRLFAATSDGKIYRDYGDRNFDLGAAVATGLGNLTNRSQFVVGGNETASADKKIFFFSGGLNQIKVCSGDNSTFASISGPAADWPNPTISSNPQSNFPNFGLIHRGRLWAFAKSVAYASTTASHEDFTSQTTLINNVGPGEGGDIIFDPEKSLSLDGDSGPYLQYAYVRARSILNQRPAADVGADHLHQG